jgi:hypothetical protein
VLVWAPEKLKLYSTVDNGGDVPKVRISATWVSHEKCTECEHFEEELYDLEGLNILVGEDAQWSVDVT